MKKLLFIFCALSIFALLSCNRHKITRTDTLRSGVAEIIVDECFAPVIQQEVNVFEGINPDATIIPIYTSEVEAFRQFVDDSVQLIVAARELTPGERKRIEDRKQRVRSIKLAIDGVALIVNKANPDTLITVSDLRRIFSGEATNWKDLNPNSKLGSIAVSFDSPNSSTARFIQDSIMGGKPFGSNIKAIASDSLLFLDAKNEKTANSKVIDFVSSTPNSMGVIGVNWVSNRKDTTNLSFINNITVMSLSEEDVATATNSYQPYPYQLAMGKYPLTRDVYIIISDIVGGLTAGFVNFAAGNEGQRIITKAGLLPANRPIRIVNIRPNL